MITAQEAINRIFKDKACPYVIGWGPSSITFYGKILSINESIATGMFLNIENNEILKWNIVDLSWIIGVFEYTEDINKYVYRYQKHINSHKKAVNEVHERYKKDREILNHEMAVMCDLEEDYDV